MNEPRAGRFFISLSHRFRQAIHTKSYVQHELSEVWIWVPLQLPFLTFSIIIPTKPVSMLRNDWIGKSRKPKRNQDTEDEKGVFKSKTDIYWLYFCDLFKLWNLHAVNWFFSSRYWTKEPQRSLNWSKTVFQLLLWPPADIIYAIRTLFFIGWKI